MQYIEIIENVIILLMWSHRPSPTLSGFHYTQNRFTNLNLPENEDNALHPGQA